MMDLDHFKNVNDALGHDAGDSVLYQFGSVCSQYLRGPDILGLLGRIGGEEFDGAGRDTLFRDHAELDGVTAFSLSCNCLMVIQVSGLHTP